MGIQLSTWVSQFCVFFLAALACGVLSRRGYLPLHISSVVGLGAYTFVASCGGAAGLHPALAAIISLGVCSLFSCLCGLILIEVRGASAALATIGIQLLLDQYFRSAEWTGGAQGIWRGIPLVSPILKLVLALALAAAGAFMYRQFVGSVASCQLITHGHSPVLSRSINLKRLPSTLCAGCLVGILSGFAAIVLSLQIAFISPSTFSLHMGILYASVILLVGYESPAVLAVGSLIIATLPEILRRFGFGQTTLSAWRGVIVGFAILAVILLQAPRLNPGATKRPVMARGTQV